MNMLERAIAFVSPGAALDRLRARTALEVITSSRAFEGGTLGRRMPARAPSTSVNVELGHASVARLRDRARDMVRNNPYCARAIDIWAGNVVGAGIVPASRTGDKRRDGKVNDLWRRFVDQCDAEGQLDFYGLQTMMVAAAFEGGDALARLRVRRAADGLRVPLQLQLMEGDHLDASRDGIFAGARTVLGIRFDAVGRRQSYWLFPDHPGDRGRFQLSGFTSQEVPATDIVHLYRKRRIGQARGVSAFAPVMLAARDLADLQDAVIVKARVEACFTGFITSEEPEGVAIGAKSKDAAGKEIQDMQPGIVTRLKPGESIEFADPKGSLAFDPVVMHTLLAIAVGLGLTYDQLTGDLRQANYSSLRAGKIEQRRLVEQVQYQTVVPMACQPIRRRWLELAILMGELDGTPDDYPCEWIAPAHEAIDPLKDLQADVIAVRSGRMTPQQFVAAWGNDPQSHFETYAEAMKQIDDLGLVLDIDARKTSQAGGLQAGKPQEDKPEMPAEEKPSSSDAGGDRQLLARAIDGMSDVIRLRGGEPSGPIAVTVNVPPIVVPEIKVPDVQVRAVVAEQKAPVVNIPAPIVNVPAPVVNVAAPPPEKRKRRTRTIVTEHDARGRVKSFEQEEI